MIPAYNAESHLTECLVSVAEQTYGNWEIIVVNDGSTDETETVAMSFADSLPGRVSVLSTDNQGLSNARNNGISLARGEFIAFLDSDDVWLPAKLQTQVDVLEANPYIVGVTSSFARFQNNDPYIYNVARFSWNRQSIDSWVAQIGQAPGLGSSLLVRRSALEALGGFDPSLGSHAEDLEFACRLFEYGRVVACDELLVGVRAWPGQIHGQTDLMDASLIKVIGTHATSASHAHRSVTHLRVRRGIRGLIARDRKRVASDLLPMLFSHPIWTLNYAMALVKQQYRHGLRKHPITFYESAASP